MANKQYEEAFGLRDHIFKEAFSLTQILSSVGKIYVFGNRERQREREREREKGREQSSNHSHLN